MIYSISADAALIESGSMWSKAEWIWNKKAATEVGSSFTAGWTAVVFCVTAWSMDLKQDLLLTACHALPKV